MFRLITILLLFAICFLGGVLYGVDHSKSTQPEVPDAAIEIPQKTKTPTNKSTATVEQTAVEQQPSPAREQLLTEKTASILEAGMKGFFEIIVQLMYQFAKLFF
ncbi:hypothetical protein DX933_11710 [Ornithinibacillus gellani]|uniref:hypothetical protein n=1 Tax=Ornithinibacillus gellani TaxID=2293253 RepID=UPI000F460747|nr:hypothetical protein [Ornithinibacillus gellani]TQS74594.1 hypothetical protein DX933_11710 [Ornithinibacillus gellani]